MTDNGQTHIIVIPANGIAPRDLAGSHFSVVHSSVPVFVRFDGGPLIRFDQGAGLNVGTPWRHVEFRNDTAASVEITVWIGSVPYVQTSRDTTEMAVDAVVDPRNSINAGATLTFTPDLTGGRYRQKAFALFNADPALSLDVLFGGSRGAIVGPAAGLTLPVSHAFSVRNPNGTAVSFAVTQLYYKP